MALTLGEVLLLLLPLAALPAAAGSAAKGARGQGQSGAAKRATTYEPPPDPGPSPHCPVDMRLVEGRHFDEVEHLCIDFRKGPRRCWAYLPDYTIAHGDAQTMRFCMDVFEAPNRRGERPLVMKTATEAAQWCGSRGKRLCAESEWETACESGDERPWFYGWALDDGVCNTSRPWKAFDAGRLAAGGEEAASEVERLWQGAASGAYASCRTAAGINDLMGNVEEWVTSSRKRRWGTALMGGFWSKPWVGCRGTNDAHEPSFRFYEVGFRCCADPLSPPP